jgi:hypothetical protein
MLNKRERLYPALHYDTYKSNGITRLLLSTLKSSTLRYKLK